MAIFRRNKSGRKRPMTNLRAGLIAIALIALFAYFGFTKTNPFASPPTVTAVFENAVGLKPKSPVRIAGVEMGKVTQVTGLPGGTGAAEVTMEVKDAALPLHTDAEAKIRTRIFLEGNFFVDIRPGTPSAPILPEGDPIPMKQTYSPVQLGDVLRVLKSDVRQDLRTLLSEFSLKGLGGGGAEAFNDTIDYMEPAYKSTSVVVDAALGENPNRDLQRVLRGQQRVAAALSVDPGALQGLVTNVNTTAGALAREDVALQASIPALRDLLRRGYPALASLNRALPTLRRFAVEALPGVRSTPRTIDASIPLLRQLRKLFTKSELRGLTRQTRAQIPRLVALNRRSAAAARRGARALLLRQQRAVCPGSSRASPRPRPTTQPGGPPPAQPQLRRPRRREPHERRQHALVPDRGGLSDQPDRVRTRGSSRCLRTRRARPRGTVLMSPARPSSRPSSPRPVPRGTRSARSTGRRRAGTRRR